MPDNGSLELHDIHLPAEPGWFPLAPGWWMLFAALLALCVVGFFLLKKRNKNKRFHGEAFNLIEAVLRKNDRKEITNSEAISEISGVLRRVALTIHGREKAAKLSGEAWLEFLNSTCKNVRFNNEEGKALINAAFQPDSTVSPTALALLAKGWIKEQRL